MTASLGSEVLNPSACLNAVCFPVRPQPEAHVVPSVDPRDKFPDARCSFKIILKYKFSVKEGGKFTPTNPQLDKWVSIDLLLQHA